MFCYIYVCMCHECLIVCLLLCVTVCVGVVAHALMCVCVCLWEREREILTVTSYVCVYGDTVHVSLNQWMCVTVCHCMFPTVLLHISVHVRVCLCVCDVCSSTLVCSVTDHEMKNKQVGSRVFWRLNPFFFFSQKKKAMMIRVDFFSLFQSVSYTKQ